MPCEANVPVALCPGPNQPTGTANVCPHCLSRSCAAPNRTATCRGPAGPALSRCPVCRGKVNIRDRRLSIANMLNNPGMTAGTLQSEWTNRAKTIVQDLYTEAFGGGGPACGYAFCITGSGARVEACPYSDLDCFLVLDPAAGVAEKNAMVAVSRVVKERLEFINWDRELSAALGAPNKGFTFCAGGLNPGGWGGVPFPLTGTAAEMAAILEQNVGGAGGAAMGHVVSGLQESSFGFGTAQLHTDFLTEVDQVMGKTCWKNCSRPKLTYLKRGGLETIRDVLADANYAVPAPNLDRYDIKKSFYRMPQFVVKGLAWYYGVNGVATEDQIQGLLAGGHMHANKARVIRQVMDAPLQIRVAAHLASGHESDWVRTPAHANADGNPKHELILSAGQANALQTAIGRLAQIRGWATTFVAQKNKVIGRRKNPFAQA